MKRYHLLLASILLAMGACDGAGEALNPEAPLDARYGKPLLETEPVTGKGDTFDGVVGPLDSGLSQDTAVWEVTRRWYEVSSEAGLAWEADSNLTWDQKYAAWVGSLPEISGADGHQTFLLTTPWGKVIESPRLECAEMSIFLRATFASWYALPFYMTAYNANYGGAMYFGHFGIVNAQGARIEGFPRFSRQYTDYTVEFRGKSNEETLAEWPRDGQLRGMLLSHTLRDDDNSRILGDGAYSGMYFDEIFLNKRAGQFMVRLLMSFGSIHLASTQNTFNLAPEAIRPGDTLLQRWQRQGIGHTLVVGRVEELPGNKRDITIFFGSMPRVQAYWYTNRYAKSYFTAANTGGPGVNSDGDSYASLGGGLKRWRTPVVKGGRWYNIVPVRDRDHFINASHTDKIAARPAEFEVLMGSLSPEEQLDLVLQRIEIAREALRMRPASCANRSRREEAFDELYTLMARSFGTDREGVDARYRELEDYVLAELEYNRSKTCCWNSTTPEMYDVIMQLNEEWMDGEHCVEPIVFMNDDGYDVFRDYAAEIGMAESWLEWTEDEACAARDVVSDTEASHRWTDFCVIHELLVDPFP